MKPRLPGLQEAGPTPPKLELPSLVAEVGERGLSLRLLGPQSCLSWHEAGLLRGWLSRQLA